MGLGDNITIQALKFASVKHKDQRRKDALEYFKGTPYVNHLIDVVYILRENGVEDFFVLAAGALHDTIEDVGVECGDIIREFGQVIGPKIAGIVVECTDDKTLPKVERKKRQIENVRYCSKEAKMVKLADKFSNVRDLDTNPPKAWSKEEIEGCFLWSFAVVRNIKGVLPPLEAKLHTLFTKRGFDKLSDSELEEKLESYYRVIEHSD